MAMLKEVAQVDDKLEGLNGWCTNREGQEAENDILKALLIKGEERQNSHSERSPHIEVGPLLYVQFLNSNDGSVLEILSPDTFGPVEPAITYQTWQHRPALRSSFCGPRNMLQHLSNVPCTVFHQSFLGLSSRDGARLGREGLTNPNI